MNTPVRFLSVLLLALASHVVLASPSPEADPTVNTISAAGNPNPNNLICDRQWFGNGPCCNMAQDDCPEGWTWRQWSKIPGECIGLNGGRCLGEFGSDCRPCIYNTGGKILCQRCY